jgi:peptidoglycan/xylan/chitin deacetylase (PgdA/CDA1 family)
MRSTPSGERSIALPILTYHRVASLDEPGLPDIRKRRTVTPTEFAAQMEWLHRQGFHAITQLQVLEALELGIALPAKPVLITFDDGYRDVVEHAAPVLARLRMPATAYVITGLVSGPDPSFVAWKDLLALERQGIEIGSHSVTHRDLTLLSDAEASAELRRSRRDLERRLGHAVPWFAYPHGAADARIVRLVRRAGYELAVTTRSGWIQESSARLQLRRVGVHAEFGVAGLAALTGSPATSG